MKELTSIAKIWFMEWRLGSKLCLHSSLRFFINISKFPNSYTKLVILLIKFMTSLVEKFVQVDKLSLEVIF